MVYVTGDTPRGQTEMSELRSSKSRRYVYKILSVTVVSELRVTERPPQRTTLQKRGEKTSTRRQDLMYVEKVS